jgi:hypothetical protein
MHFAEEEEKFRIHSEEEIYNILKDDKVMKLRKLNEDQYFTVIRELRKR